MKMSNKSLFFGSLILAIFSFFVFRKWPDKSIKVTFCDVGQGDSILIQQGFFQLLIDSGRGDRLLGCLGQVLPFWDQVFEVGLITHFDSDHMGYFGEILGIYSFEELYFIHPNKNNELIKGVMGSINKASEYGTVIKQPILGQSIVLPSGAKITLLEVDSISNGKNLSENDRSLGVLLEFDEVIMLFPGDGEIDWEQTLLKNNVLPRVDVLKIGHHGSETSTSDQFLTKVFPKLAVISVGKNSFDHPRTEILEKLSANGIQILRTDEKGDITISTNGKKIWIGDFDKRM
jgi:competence protein ComEC